MAIILGFIDRFAIKPVKCGGVRPPSTLHDSSESNVVPFCRRSGSCSGAMTSNIGCVNSSLC